MEASKAREGCVEYYVEYIVEYRVFYPEKHGTAKWQILYKIKKRSM